MNGLNDVVEAYESAQARGPAELADFLPAASHPEYREILRELVRVELEYGWKRGQPRPLEDYQALYPQLFQDKEETRELAFEEFRLRCQAGLKPSVQEYRQRFQINPDSWPGRVGVELPRASGEMRPGTCEAAWEILERLLKDVQGCDSNDEQLRLVLQGVRDSLGADAVFHWFADVKTPAVELVGPAKLSPEWCRQFGDKTLQLQGVADGQLFLPPLPVPRLPDGPVVRSAALIRISKTASAWVAALRFGSQPFEPADLKVMMLARRMLLNQRQYTQTYAKLKDALFSLIRCLTTTIDARDPYTCGHSERVARIAVRLARQMGLPSRIQSDLYLAGLLHDIGKIGIRDEVLLKKGKLTTEEFAHMQEHVIIGDRIVMTVKHLACLRPGVRCHHERFDGKGYPDRLSGKSIPLLARVLAVADSCDAMMSSRPYRSAMPTQQIDQIMAEGAGTQWDPEIIGHFLACRQELYAICQRGLGHSVLHAVENVLQPADPHGSSLPLEL